MKALIVYSSVHHGNTEKVAKAMAGELGARLLKPAEVFADMVSDCDLIGFGSGIYVSQFHRSVLSLVDSLPTSPGKQAFVFSTSGVGKAAYNERFKAKLAEKGYKVIGQFHCKGFDTYGPLKLVGGISKGRPNAEDLERAAAFARELKMKFA